MYTFIAYTANHMGNKFSGETVSGDRERLQCLSWSKLFEKVINRRQNSPPAGKEETCHIDYPGGVLT